MASRLYDLARESFLNGEIDWAGDNIKASLVSNTVYTPDTSITGDQFFDDIASVIATSGNLASKTTAAGVADAADVTFSAVSGAAVHYIVVWQDTGVPATSRLIGIIDTASGLPVTPNGGDIDVTWDNGADRIFKL